MSELISHESTVNSFYLAFYGRPADPAGLKFWAEQLANNGGDHRAIIDAFATSREAQVRFGDDTPAARIAEIYQQLFNRTPEQSGVDYWAEVVAQGNASLADVAIEILKGAQGTDQGLLDLRQQAFDAFTAEVETSGSDYAGYSSIEAARVLVRAVTPGASQADIAQVVKATVAFADIASNNPAVIDAIATGSSLLALFDTARGLLDPVVLVQALADVAQAAAGSPATLESLLRGGGMAQVLKVMPANATLQDVVNALAQGGLPAAIEVVYPSAPATPAPSAPVSSLKFDSVESGAGDRDLKDHVTKVEQADVKFTYDGAVKAGQSFQYTIDGGKHWISAGIDTSTRGVVVLKDVDLTIGAQDVPPPPPPRIGIMEAGPVEDVLTTVQLRLVDANKQEILSATETLVLDRFAEMLDVALVNATASHFAGFSTGSTNVAGFEIDGLEQGAIVQYLYMAPGANMATWQNSMPELEDGIHTVQVRQLDAAGNASEAKEMRFNLNRETPDALTIRLANDTGIDDKDGVTNDGTVIIEGLGAAWVTGWQYSVDDGKNWKFGGVSKDGVVPQLELGSLDIATGALLVRQINYAGNASAASNKLEFTFDDTNPTEILSFKRIEGELDGVLKTDQEKVDLTFGVAHKDDGIVQWRVKGSADWVTVNAYNDNGTFTLENIDLAATDPTIELQVIDAAGNVGFTDSVTIDGPAGVTVKATVAGLEITSSVAGTITLSGDPLLSNAPGGGAIVGTVLVGAQGGYRSGTIKITPEQGEPLIDDSTFIFQLGRDTNDNLGGTHMWGFAGDDKLNGSTGDDFISGGDGNDIIISRGGSDFISGGAGADTIALVVDGKGSTLHYGQNETRTGLFINGNGVEDMDRITGAEAGDVIEVGNIFKYGPGTVSNSYLTSDDSGYLAVIRGALVGGTFTANASGTSYMVQWTDDVGINSVMFNNYNGAALGLEVDREKGTLTLVDERMVSVYQDISYHFTKTASSFFLQGTPDDVQAAQTSNGLLADGSFSLYDYRTGSTAATNPSYTSGAHFGVGLDGHMNFGEALQAGVYLALWDGDTFATASGSFNSGGVAFAGGVAGNVVQQGFGLDAFGQQSHVTLNGGLVNHGARTDSLLYRSTADTSTTVTTGTRQDVIDASAGAVTIRYDKLDSAAQDLVFGFGADDKIVFESFLYPGLETFISSGALVSDELDVASSATLATLNLQYQGRLISEDAGLLFLAQDGHTGNGMLMHYVNRDSNETVDPGEVTLIATFVGGVPDYSQIERVPSGAV
ncbi:DUF4214 domain-containing protein [Massilia oculi]|uniref:DUF4214 domain-containing protein n=1 Tax=Massilia oculi TaxID=945844 RepID=UPI001AAF2775|nr:DUF4214 domain-containing protein [Massilia oculi]